VGPEDFERRIKERDGDELQTLIISCGLGVDTPYAKILKVAFEGKPAFARAFNNLFDRLYQSAPKFASELTTRHAPALFVVLRDFYVRNSERVAPPNDMFKLEQDTTADDKKITYVSHATALYDSVCEYAAYPSTFFTYIEHAMASVCKLLVANCNIPLLEIAGRESESKHERLNSACAIILVLCSVEDTGPVHLMRCAQALYEERCDFGINEWYARECDSNKRLFFLRIAGIVNKTLAGLDNLRGLDGAVGEIFAVSARDNIAQALVDAKELAQGAGLMPRASEEAMMKAFSMRVTQYAQQVASANPDPSNTLATLRSNCVFMSSTSIARVRRLVALLHQKPSGSGALYGPESLTAEQIREREHAAVSATMVIASVPDAFRCIMSHMQKYAFAALNTEALERQFLAFTNQSANDSRDMCSIIDWASENTDDEVLEAMTRDLQALCDAAFEFPAAGSTGIPTPLGAEAAFLGVSLSFVLMQGRLLAIAHSEPAQLEQWQQGRDEACDELLGRAFHVAIDYVAETVPPSQDDARNKPPLDVMIEKLTNEARGIDSRRLAFCYGLIAAHWQKLYGALLSSDLGIALSVFSGMSPCNATLERLFARRELSDRAIEAYAPRLVENMSYTHMRAASTGLVWLGALFAPAAVSSAALTPHNKKDVVTRKFWCPFMTSYTTANREYIQAAEQQRQQQTSVMSEVQWRYTKCPPPPASTTPQFEVRVGDSTVSLDVK
jgi:hypothetical protein